MSKLKEALRGMREQYESQQAPDELRRRLAELTAHPPRRRGGVIGLRRLGGSAVAALLALCIAVNTSASAAAALTGIPVLSQFISIFKFRDYQASEKGVELKLESPHISGLGDPVLEAEINAHFDRHAEQIIAQYEADVAAVSALSGGDGHETITSTYEVLVNSDRQLTISIVTTIIMASAQEYTTFYNIDKQSGALVSLRSLFTDGADYITPISEEIIRQMRDRMAADESVLYWLDSEFEKWRFTAIAADQQFYVDAKGELAISFDKYEVGPGSTGSSVFIIPPSILSGLVREGSLLDR